MVSSMAETIFDWCIKKIKKAPGKCCTISNTTHENEPIFDMIGYNGEKRIIYCYFANTTQLFQLNFQSADIEGDSFYDYLKQSYYEECLRDEWMETPFLYFVGRR